jgi:hypothetical protein
MIKLNHKWDYDYYSLIQRCQVCGCNRIKTPYPILYVYYYDGNLTPINKKPNCDAYMSNLKSNLNKLT